MDSVLYMFPEEVTIFLLIVHTGEDQESGLIPCKAIVKVFSKFSDRPFLAVFSERLSEYSSSSLSDRI